MRALLKITDVGQIIIEPDGYVRIVGFAFDGGENTEQCAQLALANAIRRLSAALGESMTGERPLS